MEYIIRNKEYFNEFEPDREKSFYTLDFQIEQLKQDFKYITSRDMLKLWIFSKDNLEKIIGQITFYNIVPYAFLSCHVGYKADKNSLIKV